ncbi:MAG: class I SAM-dependent methyltransferase, partial [Lysobacterales bacterium]
MLTVDFDRLGVGAGTKVIDVGCGAGRHTFEAFRRGADVVGFDQSVADLNDVDEILQAMKEQGEVPASAKGEAVKGDALDLPYADGTFDCVIASEILEHVPEDDRAIAELVRVLKPGGALAITVPRWLPERICWALSDEYHANEGGHIRIYRADELRDKVLAHGLAL